MIIFQIICLNIICPNLILNIIFKYVQYKIFVKQRHLNMFFLLIIKYKYIINTNNKYIILIN